MEVSFIKIGNFFTNFDMSYRLKKEIVIQLLIVPFFKIPDFNKQSIKSIVEKFKKDEADKEN